MVRFLPLLLSLLVMVPVWAGGASPVDRADLAALDLTADDTGALEGCLDTGFDPYRDTPLRAASPLLQPAEARGLPLVVRSLYETVRFRPEAVPSSSSTLFTAVVTGYRDLRQFTELEPAAGAALRERSRVAGTTTAGPLARNDEELALHVLGGLGGGRTVPVLVTGSECRGALAYRALVFERVVVFYLYDASVAYQAHQQTHRRTMAVYDRRERRLSLAPWHYGRTEPLAERSRLAAYPGSSSEGPAL